MDRRQRERDGGGKRNKSPVLQATEPRAQAAEEKAWNCISCPLASCKVALGEKELRFSVADFPFYLDLRCLVTHTSFISSNNNFLIYSMGMITESQLVFLS